MKQSMKTNLFIINAYNAISREQIENFLFQLTHYLIMGVVEEQSKETLLTNEQKNFIADFTNTVLSESCSTGFVRECDQIMHLSVTTCASQSNGNITNSIQNFTKHAK